MEYNNNFRKFLIIFLISLLTCLTISAELVVHSVNGNIKISSGGKISIANVGKTVNKNDLLSIPQKGSIEILDKETNKIFKSLKPGNISVGMIIADSKSKASDHLSNINSRLKFADRGKKEITGSRIYREKGMVTRSLNIFDPTAADIEIDPEALAQLIANTVYFGNVNSDSTLNFSSLHIETNPPVEDKTEIGFKLQNPLTTPIYFNVLKFSGVKNRIAEISPLGHPAGSYVLPGGQTMWRTQNGNFPYGERHLIIACHYSFDIDNLIEAINKIINDDMLIVNAPDPTLPVFIRLI